MSLSSKEKKNSSKSYLKLEIYQSKICQNIKVPLPYGLSILFDNFPEKCIEPINNENELLKSPKNQFIYYLNELNLSEENVLEKEFIINSYTTSIFIIKKNFASVKIPILYRKKNTQKQWFFLKDINDNICIKILINIELHSSNTIINDIKLKNNNILKLNSETIRENKINNINKSNTNYINALNHNKKIKSKNIIHNHNTYILSTNYNSDSGNSLNITNNIYMRTIDNNNIINNLNITFPFNFSPIPIFCKNNSFFIDTIKEKEKEKMKNKIFIRKSSFKSTDNNKRDKDDETIKIDDADNNDLKLISENDCDSITVNENEVCSEKDSNTDKNNNKKKDLNNKDNLLHDINNLILKKNEEIYNNQQFCSVNYNNYLKAKKDMAKDAQFLEKENEKMKLSIKKIEKSKQLYETKTINLNEKLINFNINLYRNSIQNELDNYETVMMQNINNISFAFNDIEYLSNKAKLTINNLETNNKKSYDISNKDKIYSFEINKNEISNFNKTANNAIYIKKLQFQNKIDDKYYKGVDSHRGYVREGFNKKYSPINYKLKEFNTKLSLSISNSDNLNDEYNNNDTDANNKTIKSYTNKGNNMNYNKLKNYENNKKYNNIFRDYYYDILDRNEYKKKPLKSNLIKGNLKIKIPFNENSNNNIESKYLLTKNNFNKENITQKTNSINNSKNNNISNKSINLNNSNKIKNKNNNYNTKKIKSDKYLFKTKYINNTYKKSNTNISKNFITIENVYLNNAINSDKNDNLYKKKLNKNNKIDYNKKKSFNNETFKNLNNYNNNYFKGKPVLISNNNNSYGNERYTRKDNIENDLNKKTIDSCPKTNNTNKNRIIRKKTKNNTVKNNLDINISEHIKKKNTQVPKSLNIQGDIILININKQKKSSEKDKNRINYNKKKNLTHKFSKLVGINIYNNNINNYNKDEKKEKFFINDKNNIKINKNKDKIKK